MLMFYFVTQFFRRSPTNPTTGNATLAINPTSGYKPGNLYGNGELLVSVIIFRFFLFKRFVLGYVYVY
jgi:hypothetical protein